MKKKIICSIIIDTIITGVSLEDYLGYWCPNLSGVCEHFMGLNNLRGSPTDEHIRNYLVMPYFCFRIADGVIGMKLAGLINNRKIEKKFYINGDKIHDARAMNPSHNASDFFENGVYNILDELITWNSTYNLGLASLWARPG